MWDHRQLLRIDFRVIPVLLALMVASILVISAFDPAVLHEATDSGWMTPKVKSQLQRFALGGLVFILFACFDYNRLREWAWLLYALMLVALVGVYLTSSIGRVHRWYQVPFLNASFQPSEFAKLVVVIALSWFLERRRARAGAWSTAALGLLIVGIPFVLILKQPDLGTALILFPVSLVMFYFGDVHPWVVRGLSALGIVAFIAVLLIFLGILSHDEMRPYATKFIREYQYERLDPTTHHQKAAVTAIAIGGLTGTGWRQSEYTGGGWLPAAHTDSVFPAFGEEFGFLGLLLLMVLYYALLYFSFQVTAAAKDHFGRLLSAGVTIYLAMHILINIGMMCGLLPITGVPLILMSYGGSSVLITMAALGILQSIYSRRFMF